MKAVFALYKPLIRLHAQRHGKKENNFRIFATKSPQIWIMNRMNGLQEELTSSWEEIDQQRIEIKQLVREMTELKENVNGMNKMAFDDELYDDLDEFGKKVSDDFLFWGVKGN